MGKIGDLFVRLGLKADDYKKGIKEAKKDTEGFGNKLQSLKASAVAVWAAIGTAVIKFSKDFISATNASADYWAQKTSGMKAAWHSFLADVQNSNKSIGDIFSNITNPAKGAQNLFRRLFKAEVAKESAVKMTQAFDAAFELEHSAKLQRSAVQQELNELFIMMRDTTLSSADRSAAAERYKAILQPIAEAETATYKTMMTAAIDAWQAGLTNRSTDEVIEFFTKIGTSAKEMAQKFPDLMNVYENFKSDEQNLPIFNIIESYQQAANQMSDIEKILSRTTNSIKAAEKAEAEALNKQVSKMMVDAINLKVDLDIDLDFDKEWENEMKELDEWLYEETDNLAQNLQQKFNEIAQLNKMLEDSFISSFSNGMQALSDFAVGVDGANLEQVLAAFVQPLADTMRQMGEMFIAEGLAVKAFKNSIKNPVALIAAGAALIAVSSFVTSGLNKLTGNPSGGTAATTSSQGTSSGSGIETYEQDITVHVVGEISGDKIVLAGQKTLNKWSR